MPRAGAGPGSGPTGGARTRSPAAARPPIDPSCRGKALAHPHRLRLTPNPPTRRLRAMWGAPLALARCARWSAALHAGGRSPRGVDCAHGLSWPLGSLSRFRLRLSCDGSRPGQRGKGSASPTSSPGPFAALRAAACGRALAPLTRPSPLVTRRR